MVIQQISIFLENKSGRLADVTRVMASAGINLRAISIADTADFGILRVIVDKVEAALEALGKAGFTTRTTEVLALGNPIIWWAAAGALVHQSWRWFSRRDWRSGAVVVAVLAGWLPWLGFQGRTIFTFYSVAFVPFLCMVLALTLGTMLGRSDSSPRRRTIGASVVGSLVLLALAASWFFYPVWSAEVIPYTAWQIRMWFPTWV